MPEDFENIEIENIFGAHSTEQVICTADGRNFIVDNRTGSMFGKWHWAEDDWEDEPIAWMLPEPYKE